MAFSDEVIRQAWARSGGHCECERSSHRHLTRCNQALDPNNRGREGIGAWETNHINRVESDGHDGLSNCEILCWPCHKDTF